MEIFWIASAFLLVLTIFFRRLENRILLQGRKNGERVRFGLRQFWLAFVGVIESNETISTSVNSFDHLVKRADISWLQSGTEVVAFSLLGSLVMGIMSAWCAGIASKNFVVVVMAFLGGALVGLVLIPLSVKAEEKKKTKLLAKEVMGALPLFGTYFEAGAKGKAVVEAIIDSLHQKSILKQRLMEVRDTMVSKGFSFLMSLQTVAQEWDSKALMDLYDLIEKADRSGMKTSDEIKRELDQNKESEMLSAEAEAAGKEQIILFVCIGLLYGPGMIFMLKLAMLFMDNSGF